MKILVLLSILTMLILSACVNTQESTTKDFNKVFDEAPVDLRGR